MRPVKDTEDKQKICDALLTTLQETHALHGLKSLEYRKEDPDHFNFETVTATFKHGRRIINVEMDSGIALIKDVLKALAFR